MKASRVSMLAMFSVLVVGAGCGAYGMYWVASNVVHVDVQYTVALSFSATRTVASLTAVVRNNGERVGAGVSVDFYYSRDGGDWTFFATQDTNPGGIARARYTIATSGVYDFQAAVRLP